MGRKDGADGHRLSSTPIRSNLDLVIPWNLSFIPKKTHLYEWSAISRLFALIILDTQESSIFRISSFNSDFWGNGDDLKLSSKILNFSPVILSISSNPSREPREFFRSIGLPGGWREGEGGRRRNYIPWEIRNPTGEIIQVGYAWLHNGSFSSVKTAETRWNRRSRSTGADGPGIRRGILSAGQGVFPGPPRIFLCSCTTTVVKTHWRVTWNWRVARGVSGTQYRRDEALPKNCRG